MLVTISSIDIGHEEREEVRGMLFSHRSYKKEDESIALDIFRVLLEKNDFRINKIARFYYSYENFLVNFNRFLINARKVFLSRTLYIMKIKTIRLFLISTGNNNNLYLRRKRKNNKCIIQRIKPCKL